MKYLGKITDNKDLVTKEYVDGITDNNFTNELKNKLDGIEAGAEVNSVDSVNGQTGVVSLTYSDVGAAASSHGIHVTYDTTNNPKMDGTASKGSASTVARSDHVHPTDTSRAPVSHRHSTQELDRPNGLRGLSDVTLQPLVSTARANRLAFLPADQIIIEKTTDGGTTWTDAGVSDVTKKGLFSETRPSVTLPLLNGVRNVLCGLRITITAMKYSVPDNTPETQKYNYWNSTYVQNAERYCQLKEFYFWLSSSNDSMGVTVERATGANPNNWQFVFSDASFYMTGWSGCDYIKLSNQGTFGGNKSQTTNFWNYRITLMTLGKNGSSTEMNTGFETQQQAISEIRGYGDAVWTSPNKYMAEDHMYDHDINLNVTFPNKVTATGGFSGAVTGNASSATEFKDSKSVALTGDVTGTASSKAGWSVATTLSNSGVTAGSYGPSADASPSAGDTFDVPYITVDAKGRTTAASTKKITMPSPPVTSVNNKTGAVSLTYSDVGAASASAGIPSGGASGQVLTKSSNTDYDVSWQDTDKGMTILSYGHSTWDDFITAYNANTVVYCRASSNSNPATGAQGRMAFMAYVNNGSAPTEVEFQYYRSVSSHSASQQGDQVYVYKLNKNSGWSVTVRESYTKIATGAGLSSAYNNGTITLSADATAGSDTPLMDGTASAGSSSSYSRQDHVHPSDTSKANAVHTHSASDITSGLSTVATTGSYSDLSNKPSIPDSTSDLTNDSGFITNSDIPVTSVNTKTGDVSLTYSDVGAAATNHGTHVTYSTTNPVVDGTASPGTASTVARSDHIHPTDTTRASASDLTSHTGNTSNPHSVTASQVGAVPTSRTVNGKALSSNISLTYSDVGAAATSHGTHVTYADSLTSPSMDGNPSQGTAATVSRSDHRHPSDTAKVSCRNLSDVSVDYVVENGLYFCGSSVTGLPARNNSTSWILEVVSSTSTNYVKQIAHAYSNDSLTFERHGTTGSWEPWVETSPIMRVIDSLSTMKYFRKPGATNFGSFFVMGTFAGVGGMTLLITIQNASIQSVMNMRTGAAYSGSDVTFYYGVNSTYDYGYLGIKTTSNTASSIAIIGA